MESNNVIKFPKDYFGPKQVSKEEISENLDLMKKYHIQEAVTNIAPILFNQLEIAGFPVGVDINNDLKDGAFILEALKSFMYKQYGIYHPFQILSENVFEPDNEEKDTLKIVENLNIILKGE